MNDEKLHTRVGAVLLVAIVIAVGLVLGLQGRHITPGIRVHVILQRIGTLHEGDRVMIAGTEVGTLEAIRLLPRSSPPPVAAVDDCHRPLDAGLDESTYAILDLWIDRRFSRWVRTDADFFLNQPGVLGQPYLEMGAPSTGRPDHLCPLVGDGGVVRGIDPPRLDRLLQKSFENLDATMNLLTHGMPEVAELQASLHSLRGTLEGLPSTDGIVTKAQALGSDARALWTDVQPAVHVPPALDPTLAAMKADVTAIRVQLDRMGPAIDRLQQMGGKLAPLADSIDRARALFAEGQQAVADLQSIADLVAQGKGTIGALLHDDELIDDLKETSKLIKQQPWKMGHPVDK